MSVAPNLALNKLLREDATMGQTLYFSDAFAAVCDALCAALVAIAMSMVSPMARRSQE